MVEETASFVVRSSINMGLDKEDGETVAQSSKLVTHHQSADGV